MSPAHPGLGKGGGRRLRWVQLRNAWRRDVRFWGMGKDASAAWNGGPSEAAVARDEQRVQRCALCGSGDRRSADRYLSIKFNFNVFVTPTATVPATVVIVVGGGEHTGAVLRMFSTDASEAVVLSLV
ncbi:hypothetical protein HDZ31DRAFT_68555 [Schizophyllum fasciatum]